MRTLKTAFVVVGLLGVLYGAYVVLNKPGSLPFSLSPGDDKETASQADLPQIEDPDAAPLAPSPGPLRLETNAAAPPFEARQTSVDEPAAPNMPPVFSPKQAGSPLPPEATPPDTQEHSLTDFAHGEPPAAAAPPAPGFDPAEAARRRAATAFKATWSQAEQLLSRGRLADALALLTPLYNHPELASEDRNQVNDLLDRLAGTVIYSKQYHFLEPSHKVRPNERLAEIAGIYKLPWEFLARVNNIEDPNILFNGEELKVLPGPFSAVVDLRTQELILLVKGCYAGRFPVTLGADPPPREGSYTVIRKMAPGDASNTSGSHVIDIGGGLTLFGDNGGPGARGSIGLSPRDATDLYYIFTESKSPVEIRR